MSKRQNLLGVWQQIPIANRTITLPAGSYSVRASSSQRGIVSLAGASQNTAAVSSVTTTRAQFGTNGQTSDTNDFDMFCRGTLTNATTVTVDKNDTVGNAGVTFDLAEFF